MPASLSADPAGPHRTVLLSCRQLFHTSFVVAAYVTAAALCLQHASVSLAWPAAGAGVAVTADLAADTDASVIAGCCAVPDAWLGHCRPLPDHKRAASCPAASAVTGSAKCRRNWDT